jgi:predicted GNAT superfamily acetyltransferase
VAGAAAPGGRLAGSTHRRPLVGQDTDADPWALALAAASSAGVTLRPLTSTEDADRLIEVMIATWGEHQLLPREVIVALAESGNVPLGAFDDGQLLGYVMGWAGVDERDGLHVHSHMLAAIPERRHRGVGYALKLAQRAQALEQGISVVRWTFDPLIARNAYFNLAKLGAIADRFARDFYGEMGDVLNRGERSDRLVVRWDLHRTPGPWDVRATTTIEIPEDHLALRAGDPAQAASVRDRVAERLEAELGSGLVVAGFDRGRSSYLLASPDEVGP